MGIITKRNEVYMLFLSASRHGARALGGGYQSGSSKIIT